MKAEKYKHYDGISIGNFKHLAEVSSYNSSYFQGLTKWMQS